MKEMLEVLNASIVNDLQSCLPDLCPASDDAIGGELEFVCEISYHSSSPKLLCYVHQAVSIFSA